MNIFNRVTLKTLLKNKTRTTVTIIGIILSAAMICAVTTSISSLQNFVLENMMYENGSWHGLTANATNTQLNTVKSSDKVEAYTVSQYIGYAEAVGSANKDKPYIYLMGTGEGFSDIMPVHIVSGVYPTKSDEILIPEHLATNGGVSYRLGEIITLSIGDRFFGGEQLYQNKQFYGADEESGVEELKTRQISTYKVVGFYERPGFESYSAPGYTAITVMPEDVQGPTDIYFKLYKPANIYDFMNENELGGGTNRDVLMFIGISQYDNFYSVLYGLAAIIIALIVFGSVSLIYNAFSISVSERTKQFGLLSSVGATKKQLRKSVLFEALFVSFIGIPLGIAAGVGGMWATFLFIGDEFGSLGFNSNIPMRLSVSPFAVVAAIIIALITVLISAWIPSKRATKISAIEAIRQNNDISVKSKKVKTSRLTYKLFGLSGTLANKHFKRSRKKYRATILSLFMSIVLFVSASAFSGYLTESVEGGFAASKFDIRYYTTSDILKEHPNEEIYSLLKSAASVEKTSYSIDMNRDIVISSSALSSEFKTYCDENGIEIGEEFNLFVTLNFVEDEVFKNYLKEEGISKETYFDKENPMALMFDSNTFFDNKKGKFVTIDIISELPLDAKAVGFKQIDGYYCTCDVYTGIDGERYVDYINYQTREAKEYLYDEVYVSQDSFKVNKKIQDTPYFIDSQSGMVIVYPYSMFEAVMGEGRDFAQMTYYMTSSNHTETTASIKKLLAENGLESSRLVDYVDREEQNRNIIAIINVFAYGFIILISLIAAANVFNTISTNIALRRREFAMLKSVGMTRRGFNKMMNFECILYGTRALLYGLPVSVLVTFLIFISVNEGYQTSFELPWLAIAIAVLSVFVVVFITMMYSMRKIKKDNPIDALKNENL